jgi:hypothetical protein
MYDDNVVSQRNVESRCLIGEISSLDMHDVDFIARAKKNGVEKHPISGEVHPGQTIGT